MFIVKRVGLVWAGVQVAPLPGPWIWVTLDEAQREADRRNEYERQNGKPFVGPC